MLTSYSCPSYFPFSNNHIINRNWKFRHIVVHAAWQSVQSWSLPHTLLMSGRFQILVAFLMVPHIKCWSLRLGSLVVCTSWSMIWVISVGLSSPGLTKWRLSWILTRTLHPINKLIRKQIVQMRWALLHRMCWEGILSEMLGLINYSLFLGRLRSDCRSRKKPILSSI